MALSFLVILHALNSENAILLLFIAPFPLPAQSLGCSEQWSFISYVQITLLVSFYIGGLVASVCWIWSDGCVRRILSFAFCVEDRYYLLARIYP